MGVGEPSHLGIILIEKHDKILIVNALSSGANQFLKTILYDLQAAG